MLRFFFSFKFLNKPGSFSDLKTRSVVACVGPINIVQFSKWWLSFVSGQKKKTEVIKGELNPVWDQVRRSMPALLLASSLVPPFPPTQLCTASTVSKVTSRL